MSVLVTWSRDVLSRDVSPCQLVSRCPVSCCQPPQFWRSRDVISRVFSVPVCLTTCMWNIQDVTHRNNDYDESTLSITSATRQDRLPLINSAVRCRMRRACSLVSVSLQPSPVTPTHDPVLEETGRATLAGFYLVIYELVTYCFQMIYSQAIRGGRLK